MLGLRLTRPAGGLALTLALFLAAPAAAQVAPAAWQRPDLRPVTQPAPAGGLFVLYVSQNGGLQVLGVDPASGRTVWSQPASPSDITPGEFPSLTVLGDTVIYLARNLDTTARIVAADARTGATRWETLPGRFTTWPALCPGEDAVVCVSANELTDRGGGAIRYDAATGRRLPSPSIPGDEPREVGDGLLDTGDRDPERLVAVRGASVLWTRPLADVFGRDKTTDFGWNFSRYEPLGLFVGWVGSDPDERGGRTVFDLGDERTVGFRIADGRPVWRARGEFVCSILPCPGADQSGYSSPGGTTSPPATAVRLVERGRLSFGASPTARGQLSRDARVTIEGFSLRTGRARWRFRAGRNVGLMAFTSFPAQTGLLTIVLRDDRRRLRALDLATGARRSAPPTTTGWCRRDITYRQTIGFESAEGTLHEYVGQPALVPCAAATGRRLPAPATIPPFVAAIGATLGGVVAWTDRTGLFGRPAAPAAP